MELETSTWMMIFFIISLVVSIWKIYAFLPNKALADDDTTKESQEELIHIVIAVIKKAPKVLTSSELFDAVKNDSKFDKEHFWRFNPNKLNQLLTQYYIQEKDVNSIEDIFNKNKGSI